LEPISSSVVCRVGLLAVDILLRVVARSPLVIHYQHDLRMLVMVKRALLVITNKTWNKAKCISVYQPAADAESTNGATVEASFAVFTRFPPPSSRGITR